MCRIVDEVFEGEGERDNPNHMQSSGHPARRRRQALEGMAGHERVGGRRHGDMFARWFSRRDQIGYIFLCISIYLGNREVYISKSWVEGIRRRQPCASKVAQTRMFSFSLIQVLRKCPVYFEDKYPTAPSQHDISGATKDGRGFGGGSLKQESQIRG